MGSQVSQLIDEEKINWVRPHELVYNPDLRKQQLLLLPKFARKLQLCYQTDRFFQYIMFLIASSMLELMILKKTLHLHH